ncbi:MAG: TauD/TfdA family dioxygenase [Deltaproteobacteria bacterium]
MSTAKGIEIRPVAAGFGAEIRGVDLAGDVSDSTIGEIRDTLARFGVIFLHEQSLSPEQHIAFAERFGTINVNRFFQSVEGHPQIAEVRKEPEQKINIGGGWHTDHSYDQVPAMGSVLYALEVPSAGGDTLFANMALAYESLSDGLKKTLDGLNAVHSGRHVFGAKAVTQAKENKDDLEGRLGNPGAVIEDVVHPVVIRHPESGRRTLYVNPGFTLHFEGWSPGESAPLLRFLYKHATLPERTIRFHWGKGSVAFWDNRATWHYALNDYAGERRLLHRITLEGVPIHRAAA